MFSLTKQFCFNKVFCILSPMFLQPPAAVSLAVSTWQVTPGKSVAICSIEYICYNIILLLSTPTGHKRRKQPDNMRTR